MFKGGKTILSLSVVSLFALSAVGCGYPELVERGEKAPESHKCGECHMDIYEEWKDSPHANSFSNPAFKEASYSYRFEFCLGCHAPESIFIPPGPGYPAVPAPRQANRAEGVNCNGCHLTEDCRLAGPLKGKGPHPIRNEHVLYRRSILCGTCHRGTFSEWQSIPETSPETSAEAKKTCQECHMPGVKRKLIQDAPWRWLYSNKPSKSHTFSAEDGLKTAEAPVRIELVELRRNGPDVAGVIEIENRSVPHSIPTGDYGYKEVTLAIEVADASGRKKLVKEESFFKEMGTALGYREKRPVEFSIPGGLNGEGHRLDVTLIRRAFNGDTRTVLAEESIPIGLIR